MLHSESFVGRTAIFQMVVTLFFANKNFFTYSSPIIILLRVRKCVRMANIGKHLRECGSVGMEVGKELVKLKCGEGVGMEVGKEWVKLKCGEGVGEGVGEVEVWEWKWGRSV